MSGGEPLNRRLRRLRREAEPATEAAEAPPSAERRAATQPPAAARPLPNWFRNRRSTSVAPEPRGSVEPLADLRTEDGPHGELCARETQFPHEHRHGDAPLAEVFASSAEWLTLVAKDPALADLDPRRAVYLDTETTGLSGGAGTYVFLCALGTFDASGFAVWQGFLRGPEDEPAMLSAAAERIRAADCVVSFFGKSFDRHRLEDKMRIHGIAPPFADRPHLDLYHPCRRLYREALPDGRLQTAESHLCGVRRADDLPGSRAPEAWFDYLAGRAHRVEDVFRHNLDDVLSLVSLTAHLGRLPDTDRDESDPARACSRRTALARLLLAQHRAEEAAAWIERALPCAATTSARRELLSLRAGVRRELGDPAAAIEDLSATAENIDDELSCRSWVEIAKLEEHTRRDPRAALAACRRARTVADALHAAHTTVVTDLQKREARLTSKLERPKR